MGYRSEVVLAVHKQVMGKFLQLVGQHQDMKALCFSHSDEVREDYNGEGNFLFRWSSIKWYEDYAGTPNGINAINEFMEWCHDAMIEDKNYPAGSAQGDEYFKFIRVGEEQDDIVNDGHCEDFQIYTCTSIEVY